MQVLDLPSLPTGADTLVTLVREMRRAPVPAARACTRLHAPARACSVVSVDDWCLRRGQTYGAILGDLARHRVVDLLPDREADTFTFAAWLQSQPQICVISRDRGANCAAGAPRGAPQAIQVADRFHILKHRVEALQHVLGREQAALRAAARAVAGTPQLAPRGMTAPRARPSSSSSPTTSALCCGPPAAGRGQDDPPDQRRSAQRSQHPAPLLAGTHLSRDRRSAHASLAPLAL
ncbi:MAG TPA: transposase [Ktedonobacterales bacterium]|nr:transposase [Ktedonobacterales bacterium]